MSKVSVLSQRRSGFTIVELLIVVVVIAILAAITVVSYNGISSSAKTASIESSVSDIKKKIELYRVASGADGGFPTYAQLTSEGGPAESQLGALKDKVVRGNWWGKPSATPEEPILLNDDCDPQGKGIVIVHYNYKTKQSVEDWLGVCWPPVDG